MYAPEAGEKSKPRATPGHEHIIAIVTAALIFIVVAVGPLVSDKMHEQIEGSAVQNSLRNLSSPFFDKPQATKQKAALNNSRYNYALSSCGAKVLFSSRGAAHSSSILNSNMDSYMIVDCIHTKEAIPQTNEGKDREPADDGDPEEAWVIIELCQAIRTDGIEISNFELFSAQFKNVTVYGSFNSPGQDSWVLLGNFITSNVLQSQKFPLLSVWCRYIKIVVHSHWGNERFCTISSIKVFGNSLVEDMITWQEENTNKLLLEGETNPSQQQIQPEPHTKATTDRQNDDDDDDDTTLNNLSETDDNTTLQHSVNMTDDSDDGDEDEIPEIIVLNLTTEEEDTESINEDEDSNSTLIHTEDKKETEKNNSEQNSTDQERTEAEKTYDSRTRCINYLSLFGYDLSKNYIRSSTTNTTFFSTCEKYAIEEIFFLNETKTNDTVKKDAENNTETDKQKENMTKKLFTPQLPFDKLKMKCKQHQIYAHVLIHYAYRFNT